MLHIITLSSLEYGQEVYRYATEEEAENGLFRLFASAVAYCRDDQLERLLALDHRDYYTIDMDVVARHPELTQEYRDRLYALDEGALTQERCFWEAVHDYR